MFVGCGNKVPRPGRPKQLKGALSVLEAGSPQSRRRQSMRPLRPEGRTRARPLPRLCRQPAILAFLVDLPLHPLPSSSRAFSPVCLSLCLFSSSYEDPKHIKLSSHAPAGGPHLTFILITSAKTVFPDEVTSMAPGPQARLSPAGGVGGAFQSWADQDGDGDGDGAPIPGTGAEIGNH